MILPDWRLRELCGWSPPLVRPHPEDIQFQPASIDMRLDNRFRHPSGPEYVKDHVVLLPGDLILASTKEIVSIPHDHAARVEGRSSLGRKGLLAHATAGWIDPGFTGHITLELVNAGREVIELEAGQRIAQLCVMQMLGAAARPYGHPELGSKYQNEQGATSARKDRIA